MEDGLHQRVEAGGRLIQQEQFDIGRERGDQGNLLPVALRVGTAFLSRVEVESFDQFVSPGGVQPAAEAPEQVDGLADDADRYTAQELARGLRVSPAAISGAVRHLVQIGLLGREREPGARTDTYRVFDDDVWYAITMQREEALKRSVDFLAEGVKLLDRARPGGRRVRETLEYYRFMREELPQSLERWRQRRRTVFSGESSDSHDDR